MILNNKALNVKFERNKKIYNLVKNFCILIFTKSSEVPVTIVTCMNGNSDNVTRACVANKQHTLTQSPTAHLMHTITNSTPSCNHQQHTSCTQSPTAHPHAITNSTPHAHNHKQHTLMQSPTAHLMHTITNSTPSHNHKQHTSCTQSPTSFSRHYHQTLTYSRDNVVLIIDSAVNSRSNDGNLWISIGYRMDTCTSIQ